MPICKYCGKQINSGDRFCTNCGSPTELMSSAYGYQPAGAPQPKQRHHGVGIVISLAVLIVLAAGAFGAWKLGILPGKNDDGGQTAAEAAATTGDTGAEAKTLSAAKESPAEETEPKNVSCCVFVKDGQVFYIDNIDKTPVYLVDMPESDYEDPSKTEYENIRARFRNLYYRYYPSSRIVLHSGSEPDSGWGYKSLWIKDVSSQNGEDVFIASNVDSHYTYLDKNEMAVYYTITMYPDNGYPVASDFVKYRYDIQTGESVLWEKGGTIDDVINVYGSQEIVQILYGLDLIESVEVPDGAELLAKYSTGEMHYLRFNEGSSGSASIYYWDGNSESYVCDVDHVPNTYSYSVQGSNSQSKVMAMIYGGQYALVAVKDKGYILNSFLAEGSDVRQVKITVDGDTGYCPVTPCEEGGDRGLYKFDILGDGIGPLELIDPDVCYSDKQTTLNGLCWQQGDDIYHVRRDKSVCFNGQVVDPTGGMERELGFLGDELLYIADSQTPDGEYGLIGYPYTLRTASPQGYQDINSCVIDYKCDADSLWFIGDYDYWSKGTLYLFEDGEAVSLVNDVNVVG